MIQNKFNLALIATLALTPLTEVNAAAAHSAQTVFPAIKLSADFSADAALAMIQTHLNTFQFSGFAQNETCQVKLQKSRTYNSQWFTYACQNAFSNSGKTPITLDAISFIRQFVASCTQKPTGLETSLLWCHKMLEMVHIVDSHRVLSADIRVRLLKQEESMLQYAKLAKQYAPELFSNLLRYMVDRPSLYEEFALWPNSLLNYRRDSPFSGSSYYNLACAIRQGHVSTSESLTPLDESNRYLESARLYRMSIRKGLGIACANLAALINLGLVSTDENDKPIFKVNKHLVIIRLLEKAVTLGYDKARSDLAQMKMMHLTAANEGRDFHRIRQDAQNGKNSALVTFSLLILDGKIDVDENNNKFKGNERYKNASRLLRLAVQQGGGDAANCLADLIVQGHIHTDENNIPFDDADRFVIAAKLFRIAIQKGYNNAFYSLANLIHQHGITHDENNTPIAPEQKHHVSAAMFIKSIKGWKQYCTTSIRHSDYGEAY